jgi:hypothetical protein
VGSDVTTDFENDLRVTYERNQAHVTTPRDARDIRSHATAEAREPRPRERLSPDPEQVAGGCVRSARDLDHTGRRGRPHRVGAARADDVRPLAPERRCHPDACRNEQHASVREQLDVRPNARAGRGAAAKPPDRSAVEDALRCSRNPILGADADRRGNRRAAAQRAEQRDDDRSTKHAQRIVSRFLDPAARTAPLRSPP